MRAFAGDGARQSTIRPPGTHSSRACCGSSTTTIAVVVSPVVMGRSRHGERSVTAVSARRLPRQGLLSLRRNRVARLANSTGCRSFTSTRRIRARWRWLRGKKWPLWNVRVRDRSLSGLLLTHLIRHQTLRRLQYYLIFFYNRVCFCMRYMKSRSECFLPP